MLGKGKYRVTSTMGGVKVVDWSPYEINTFWTAWLKHGTNWKAISAEIYFRTPSECRDAFKTLTTNAIKDAPGWLRIEVSKYVTATLRNARSTKQLETDDTIADSSSQKRTQWTAAEHEALLKSVEKHGLFSGWDNIRSLVKPELTNDEVEAEYYSLTGVNLGGDSDGNVTVEPMNSEWTADQVKRLNIVLMRYCTLPVWIGEAAKHGVETRDNDPETIFALFQGTSESQTEETGGNNQPAPRDSMGMSPPVWTKECIVRLKRMVRQQQQQERASGQPVNWSWVAEHIGPGFDASACITKWQDMPAKSKERLGPSTYWDDDDIEQLRKGMAAYGRGWSLIHRAYLPRRSTDSIRRKVENIKKARVDLVRETKKTAKFMQASDSSLDVEEFVHRTLKDNPVYVLSKELDDLCLRSSHSKSKNFETTSGVEGPSSPSPASRIEDEGDKEVAASVDAPSASRPQPGSPNESPAINKPQSVSASLYRLRGRPKRVSMPSDSSLP
ncbi:hypothetical protein BGX31_004577 [Mortierella sp. GBA43]|nr:hypothetical protein BGX31_004577 [Mortierella sp. GBA43]